MLSTREILIAHFDDIGKARQAIEDLQLNNIDQQDIGFIACDRDGEFATVLQPNHRGEVGAVAGAWMELLTGMTAATVPGLGAVIVAGPLIAVTGAASGGVLGSMLGMSLLDDNTNYYTQALRRGGCLVSVMTDAMSMATIVWILDQHKPIDIHDRDVFWEQSGLSKFDPVYS